MPSRLGVGLIALFWLATTAYVADREVIPRLRTDAPPAIRIDLSDEATQTVPARWTMWRGADKIGTLNTRMEYLREDDAFQFVSTYSNLRLDVNAIGLVVRLEAPQLNATLRVGRAGELKAQRVHGKLVVRVGPVEANADLDANARVTAGTLAGTLAIQSPYGNVSEPLAPVPVPAGQVLSPLQPVNRLRDVRPGRRWLVYVSNPLAAASGALIERLKKMAPGAALLPDTGGERPPLVAEVGDRPEVLVRARGESVGCWVIDYRGGAVTARTWVGVEDGKVLRQEATQHGDTLRFERED